MTIREDRSRPDMPFSVITKIAGTEFETHPIRSAGEANVIQARLTEQLQLLELAKIDPHLTDLLRLFTHRGDRPSKAQLMMAVAHLMALRSTCARLRVGCVITDPGMTTIYSVGYNGNYAGGPNVCDSVEPGSCGCLHAEDNALVKLRTETGDLKLFTTHSPCLLCAKRIANQGGLLTVYYDERYRDDAGLAILHTAGVVTLKLEDKVEDTLDRIKDVCDATDVTRVEAHALLTQLATVVDAE